MISWRNLWGQHLQTDFRAGAGPGRTAERDCVKWLSLFVQRVGAVILQDRCPANGTRPQQVFSLTKVMFTSMAGRRHWQRPLCPSSLVCLFATDTSSKKHSFLSFQSFRALVGAAETSQQKNSSRVGGVAAAETGRTAAFRQDLSTSNQCSFSSFVDFRFSERSFVSNQRQQPVIARNFQAGKTL